MTVERTPLEQKRIKQRKEFELLIWEIDNLDLGQSDSINKVLDYNKILERAATLPAAYDKEITERICDKFNLHIAQSNAFKSTIKEIRAEMNPSKAKKVKPPEARREDYFELINSVLGETRRDIFTGKLMYWDSSINFWCSAWNKILLIKSKAKDYESEGVLSFSLGLIECYLAALEENSPLQLIPTVKLAQWDGVDRISLMAKCLVLKGDQPGFTSEVVQELIKDWLVKAWKRFSDPSIRNRILILKGEQNIGKDFLIDVLCGALGQWSQNLTITKNERDNLIQLTSAAVLKIAEFDRTSATDVGLLKHMVTAKDVDLRAAYARDSQRYVSRCSFAASCNVEDIFRDATGHSRYIVINVTDVIKDYDISIEASKQILAQAKALAEKDFKASKNTEKILSDYLNDKKPSTMEEDILESFNECFWDWWENEAEFFTKSEIGKRGWITNLELRKSGVLDEVVRECGVRGGVRIVQKKLKLAGLAKKNNNIRGYAVSVPFNDISRDEQLARPSESEKIDSVELSEIRDVKIDDGIDDDIPF